MLETGYEKYKRLVGEATAAKPQPATPIKDLDVDLSETGITITRTDQVLQADEVQRRTLAEGPQHPEVDLSEAQMDAVCAFWAEIKKALQG